MCLDPISPTPPDTTVSLTQKQKQETLNVGVSSSKVELLFVSLDSASRAHKEDYLSPLLWQKLTRQVVLTFSEL